MRSIRISVDKFYFGFESETDQICTMTFKSINFESYE